MGAQLEANGCAAEPVASAEAETMEEESAPVGPSEEEESAFLAGGGAERDPMETPPVASEEELRGALPALEVLVKRIPAEVLTTMDELFRAKFVKVQRVPKRSLKR